MFFCFFRKWDWFWSHRGAPEAQAKPSEIESYEKKLLDL